MKKESLEEIRRLLIPVISNADIDAMDKTELLINLYHFLDIKNYEESINILIKKRNGIR